MTRHQSPTDEATLDICLSLSLSKNKNRDSQSPQMEVSSILNVKPNQHLWFCSSSICLRSQFLRRRKCLGLRFPAATPKRRLCFRISAALDSQTLVVVVSFVAASAVTVFYFNRKPYHHESNKNSNLLDHSHSQQGPITHNYAVNGTNSSNDDVEDISHYFPSSIIVSSPSCEVKSSINKDFVMLEEP